MKTLIFLFALLSLVSCGAKKVYHTSLSISPEASKFVASFEAQSGKKISDLEVSFSTLSDSRVMGYCQTGTRVQKETTINGIVEHVYATPKVVINTYWWDRITPAGKEQLVFHELGHCILNRPHTTTLDSQGTPVSIMHPYHLGTNLYVSNYSSYIAELFSRPAYAFSGMTFDETKYASLANEEMLIETEHDDLALEELHDCVHDKGTTVINLDQAKSNE